MKITAFQNFTLTSKPSYITLSLEIMLYVSNSSMSAQNIVCEELDELSAIVGASNASRQTTPFCLVKLHEEFS